MTPKQQRFVDEYLIDLNATQAAVRAGYSAKTADTQGPRLLENVGVAAEISARMEKRSEKVGITSENVLSEIAVIAFLDPKYIAGQNVRGPNDIAKLPENVRRAIVGWKFTDNGFEIKLADKPRALEQLARHLGLFNDKLNVDMSVGLAERVQRARERAEEIESRGGVAVVAPNDKTGVDVLEVETGIARPPNGGTAANAPASQPRIGEHVRIAPAAQSPRPTPNDTAYARHVARQAPARVSWREKPPLTEIEPPARVRADYDPYKEQE